MKRHRYSVDEMATGIAIREHFLAIHRQLDSVLTGDEAHNFACYLCVI